MPHLSLSDEEIEDPGIVLQQVTAALQAGIPLRRAEVYERTSWTHPTPDDEVFEGGGGGGGGGGDPMAAMMGGM
jgi:hypothetical protein